MYLFSFTVSGNLGADLVWRDRYNFMVDGYSVNIVWTAVNASCQQCSSPQAWNKTKNALEDFTHRP